MIALEVAVSDRSDLYDSYPPCRLMVLMRLYHYLNDSRPPMDPDTAGTLQKVFGPGGWREEAQAKRADIDNAMSKLMVVDAEMFEAVSDFIDGIPQRETAECLRLSHPTVAARRDEGIWYMARCLGWDGDCCDAAGVKCPDKGGID
jgi:hypothetical protein